MTPRVLAIAKIGEMDQGGGAAMVASGLMRGYAERGHRVWQFVGRKRGDDPDVIAMADDDRLPARLSGYTGTQRLLRRIAARHPDRGWGLLSRSLRFATHPKALAGKWRGLEDFEFPSSHHLFDSLDRPPDIVHGHNLHGGFFDLRALEAISRASTTVLTLHDMWLMTGHCAHALSCERWQQGCGACPDLSLDPAISRDASRENWQRKQDVVSRSRLHVAMPSAWLREQFDRSALRPLVTQVRVIPNGVDTRMFTPADRRAARAALRLPDDRDVVLLTTGSRGSMWKDDHTLRSAIERLIDLRGRDKLLFVAVGRDSAVRLPDVPARTEEFVHDPVQMSRYYQAADLYLHAARADTFPLAILEAMACGTSVIATKVGGIGEQIVTVDLASLRAGSIGDATGVLVDQAASRDMAEAASLLLGDADLRARLGRQAAASVQERFSLDRQVDSYLSWYRELLEAS